jgi:competence protein ComEC
VPLIFAAYLAFAAGLLSGFGGEVVFGAVVATVAIAGGALRRDGRAASLGLLVAAGVLIALAVLRADERCTDAVASGGPHAFVMQDDAHPGARARAELDAAPCVVRASLFVDRGVAEEGARAVVQGQSLRTSTGVMVQHATLVRTAPPSLLMRWRVHAGRAIDRIFGSDAPLARALLIADMRSVDPAVRSRFADAGMIHMLSVSGLHVAIIAAAIELLFTAARASRPVAAWGSLIATAVYVLVIGAPAPAVRSGVMLGVGAVTRLAQRATSPWAALALGALLPLRDPRIVLDLGYQLSVTGIAALIAAGALGRRVFSDRLSGWRRLIARDLLASSVASVVTLPLTAWTFGRVSLVAPFSNALAGPLFAVMQPTLFLALLLAPVGTAASFVAGVAHLQLVAVDGLAAGAARVPFAVLTVAPSLVTATLLAALVGALLVACLSEFPARPCLVAGAILTSLVWGGWAPSSSGAEVELHMLDVGQGDAIALRTPKGRWILFDAGRIWESGDAGRSMIIPYLRRRGGDLVAFVLSHPHSDHVGGAATVLRAMHPREYRDGAYIAPNEAYRASLDVAAQQRMAWRRVRPDDSLSVDGVWIRFLAPDSAWVMTLKDANEASAVALIRYGEIRFLLMGDAERGEEEYLLGRTPELLRADVLKVGHHGSSTSSTPAFLDAVRPRIALVSVGAGNSYGHPSPHVMQALVARGAQVLRTDRLGAVVVHTDGHRITLEANGERWTP